MEIITANKSDKVQIPDNILEFGLGKGANTGFWKSDFKQMKRYYRVYRKGQKFNTEGTGGDYVPSDQRFKICANIINKIARFLFAEPCEIDIDKRSDSSKITEKDKENITNIKDYVEEVLSENNFFEELLKSAKDALIAKRVAIMVNFSKESGIDIVFFNGLDFVYDLDLDTNELKMFTAYKAIKKSSIKEQQRYLCKKYTKEEDGIYLEERIYNGVGELKNTPLKRTKTVLKRIPVWIVLNDGLIGEEYGESDIAKIMGYEEVYSRLSNADIDAQRKTMNPVVYTIDMEETSTKNLPRSPASFWDLISDPNHPQAKPSVGTIESTMAYSDPLDLTLSRTKDSAYEELEVPNITSEMLKGNVTTGKALKAIYWPLIVRCKEKMLSWSPAIRGVISMIIEGLQLYPSITKRYVFEKIDKMDVEIKVKSIFPLPEDELEQRRADLESVQAHTMSKRTFMKKWGSMSENEANDEFAMVLEEVELEADATVSETGDGERIGQKYTYKYDYKGKGSDSEGNGNNSIKEGLNTNKVHEQRRNRKISTVEETE